MEQVSQKMKALNIFIIHVTHVVHFFDLGTNNFLKELFLFHFFNPDGNGSGKGNSDVTLGSEYVFGEKLSDFVFVLIFDHELLLESLDELC